MKAYRTKRAFAAAAAAAVATTGCSLGLGDLPLPAPGVGTAGGYTLTAVFENALNLPAEANVKLSGADVGTLKSLVAKNYTAVAELQIKNGVQIPVGSTVELRSATPLGDVFVAINPPVPAKPGAALLKDGDTVGLDSTGAAATVESVLSSAAIVVNGGTIRNLTNLINGAGKATGDQGEAMGNLINLTDEVLGKLNARSAEIETALTETSALADRLDEKNPQLTEILEAMGPATDVLAANTNGITNAVQQLGATTRQLGRFPSIAGTDDSGRSVIRDMNTLSRAWNDVALSPDTSLAALNRLIPVLVKSTSGSAINLTAGIDRLILGSIPDIGFKGDPAFHGPKRGDWATMVGSIKYVLWRLQERVVGQGPNSPMGQTQWAPIGAPLPPSPSEHGPLPGPPPAPSGQEPPR
ncbi:MAG: MlaD family protein [Mycolicibacterium sp.]|uniref:MlaD family protein n=1 Tax=Mycolicibacterium sp. TaxID=2320850 RepID=UPI003D0F6C65